MYSWVESKWGLESIFFVGWLPFHMSKGNLNIPSFLSLSPSLSPLVFTVKPLVFTMIWDWTWIDIYVELSFTMNWDLQWIYIYDELGFLFYSEFTGKALEFCLDLYQWMKKQHHQGIFWSFCFFIIHPLDIFWTISNLGIIFYMIKGNGRKDIQHLRYLKWFKFYLISCVDQDQTSKQHL